MSGRYSFPVPLGLGGRVGLTRPSSHWTSCQSIGRSIKSRVFCRTDSGVLATVGIHCPRVGECRRIVHRSAVRRHEVICTHSKTCTLYEPETKFRLQKNWVDSALHPSRVAQSSTSFGWVKDGNVTSAGWQVTLCDPVWHVSSRSSAATLRTAIHLLLTYLLYIASPSSEIGSSPLKGCGGNCRPGGK